MQPHLLDGGIAIARLADDVPPLAPLEQFSDYESVVGFVVSYDDPDTAIPRALHVPLFRDGRRPRRRARRTRTLTHLTRPTAS